MHIFSCPRVSLLLAVGLLVGASCGHGSDVDPESTRLLTELTRLSSETDRKDLVSRNSSGGLDGRDGLEILLDERSNRTIQIDAEDLAEGGAESTLLEIFALLSRTHGVRVPVISTDSSYPDYILNVDGRSVTIWTEQELVRLWSELDEDLKHRSSPEAIGWALTPSRVFAIADEALIVSGSADRLFALGGGNDMTIVICDSELAVWVSKDQSPENKVYKPSDQPPRLRVSDVLGFRSHLLGRGVVQHDMELQALAGQY